MAFTPTEELEIFAFMGWQARFGQTDSALVRAIRSAESAPEVETYIRDQLLPRLRIQRDKMSEESIQKRFKVNSAGSINLSSGVGHEWAQVQNVGRNLVVQLAQLLGVETKADIFGTERVRFSATYATRTQGGPGQFGF